MAPQIRNPYLYILTGYDSKGKALAQITGETLVVSSLGPLLAIEEEKHGPLVRWTLDVALPQKES